jgi:hypothetical protein
MISTAEALEFILLSLLPETCINIESIEVLQSERLRYTWQGGLPTIGYQEIFVLNQSVIVHTNRARIDHLGKLVL